MPPYSVMPWKVKSPSVIDGGKCRAVGTSGAGAAPGEAETTPGTALSGAWLWVPSVVCAFAALPKQNASKAQRHTKDI